jgi:hypothetical protein
MVGTRSRARHPVAVTVATVATLVSTGCGFLGDGPPDPARVVIVGDSITHASDEEIRALLADRDVELTMAAMPGATVEHMEERVRELDGETVDQAVINLGTNDVSFEVDPDRTRALLTELVDHFPDARCVHIVTVNDRLASPEDPAAADRIDAVNEAITDLAARDHVAVIDWNAILDDPPDDLEADDILADDDVHTSDLGQEILAEVYLRALMSCGA